MRFNRHTKYLCSSNAIGCSLNTPLFWFSATIPEEEKDPLERTGKLFGGLVRDVKRKFPHYLSDLTDAFNPHCLVAFFFVYFALLAPCIAFGGLLSSKTEQWMGVSEMILATSLSGVVFGLFAGQPLIIIGGTGPVLVFEESTYEVSLNKVLLQSVPLIIIIMQAKLEYILKVNSSLFWACGRCLHISDLEINNDRNKLPLTGNISFLPVMLTAWLVGCEKILGPKSKFEMCCVITSLVACDACGCV